MLYSLWHVVVLLIILSLIFKDVRALVSGFGTRGSSPGVHRSRVSGRGVQLSPGRRAVRREFDSKLWSYGDPDTLDKWERLRWVQDKAREVDEIMYPNEHDVPGLTFKSPVEWAPWMETIWFGNAYEYRSAYFHDVMYSNNRPYREGALLYSDPEKAKQIALLYQRYKKFDESTYSLANATFFNVFGATTMRVGRYKVPLDNDVILCTTDPLTTSEMKRYFNSFSPLKWFKSKLMQQKRKRQFKLNILQKNEGVGNSDCFFTNSVYLIEHGRWNSNELKKKEEGKKSTIPISSISLPKSAIVTVPQNLGGESKLIVPLNVANSQYFLENLIQSVFNYFDLKSNANILVGGDGRLLNDFATEILLRIAAGNNINKVTLAKRGLMTSSSALFILAGRKNKSKEEISFVWTGGDSAGGIRGSFGLQLILSSSIIDRIQGKQGGEGTSTSTPITVNENMWSEILDEMEQNDQVRMVSNRPRLGKYPLKFPEDERIFIDTVIGTVNPMQKYLSAAKEKFDFTGLQTYLSKSDLNFTIDTMNSASAAFVRVVLKELEQDPEKRMLNGKVLDDFGGRVPKASIDTTSDSFELYKIQVPEVQNIVSVDLERKRKKSSYESPDIGFVLDANAESCMVVANGVCIKKADARAILEYNSIDIAKAPRYGSDGIETILGWLTMFQKLDAGKDIVHKQLGSLWERNGRKINANLELPMTEKNAVNVMKNLRDNASSCNWAKTTVKGLEIVQNKNTTVLSETNRTKSKKKVLPDTFGALRNKSMESTILIEFNPSSQSDVGIDNITSFKVIISLSNIEDVDEKTISLEEEKDLTDKSSEEDEDEEGKEEEGGLLRKGLLEGAFQNEDEDISLSTNRQATISVDISLTTTSEDNRVLGIQGDEEILGRLFARIKSDAQLEGLCDDANLTLLDE